MDYGAVRRQRRRGRSSKRKRERPTVAARNRAALSTTRPLATLALVEDVIEPPILVAEGNDLAVHPSVESAQREVESPDVDDYQVFDSMGRKLRFLGKTEPTGRWIKSVAVEPVHLVAEEQNPTHQDELRALIIRCLAAVGEASNELEGLSLEELVRETRQRFAVT